VEKEKYVEKLDASYISFHDFASFLTVGFWRNSIYGFKTCHFPITGLPPLQGSNSLSIIIYRIQTRRGTFKE
jgi:hypothetical protein